MGGEHDGPAPVGYRETATMPTHLPRDVIDLLRGEDRPEKPGEPIGEIQILPVDFRLSHEQRLRGYTLVPSFVRRRKRLEMAWERFWREMAERHEQWRESGGGPWATEARNVDLTPINQVIEAYNSYFPIEADLGTDPKTGKYRMGAGAWEPEPLVTVEDVAHGFDGEQD